ncbi:MAG TPA: hypothetical protein VKX49_09445 [Bryobacteraceae bacterium]|nr:hypothetical protein [Bryobacteraceae bacterium]
MASRRVMEAKELLEEAKEWGMFTWASEENKSRVQSAIEGSTQILDREVEKVKKSWNKTLQKAYEGQDGDPRLGRALRKLHDTEDALAQITAQSKETFAEAERELSAGKARQGVVQALHAINLHEAVLEMARTIGA